MSKYCVTTVNARKCINMHQYALISVYLLQKNVNIKMGAGFIHCSRK